MCRKYKLWGDGQCVYWSGVYTRSGTLEPRAEVTTNGKQRTGDRFISHLRKLGQPLSPGRPLTMFTSETMSMLATSIRIPTSTGGPAGEVDHSKDSL